MEVGDGSRICRENGADERGKSQSSRRSAVVRAASFKKVQVVYYLSRNGQLEHPHYMEVTHLAHQHLRLKDVIDRLTVLRGRGMPSLYSWSCKRSYKNGYVWNDLAEYDIICPIEGAEYVLKGSEILQGSTESPQLMRNTQVQDSSNFLPKRKSGGSKQHADEPEIAQNNHNYIDDNEDELYEEKSSYTSSTTPNSTCSRGVCTDDQNELTRKNPTKLSPPSATSSSISDMPNNNACTTISKRFEDGDPVAATGSLMTRNSVLFQFISCGGSMPFKVKDAETQHPSLNVKQQKLPPLPSPPSTVVPRKSSSSSCASFHKRVLCKAAEAEVEEIKYMSENPRFGNLQSAEKEYFSGSIVESMTTEERTAAQVDPQLKKSSSYNEERSSNAELGEVAAEEEELKKEKAGVKGKCIPRKKSSKHSKS
ncbi:hypothetical protein BC332_30411 [Capsicum chinense]|nr:protein SOSEKI 2 [Capsicum annuum]PHU00624.1 hypothetical protein BC332_30411 [Capsicum chinense]